MAARHGTALSYPSELAAGCPLHAAGEDTVRHSSGTPSFVSDEPTHCVNLMRSGGVHSNARGTCRGPWICGWIELIFNVWATSIGNRPFPCSHFSKPFAETASRRAKKREACITTRPRRLDAHADAGPGARANLGYDSRGSFDLGKFCVTTLWLSHPTAGQLHTLWLINLQI